MSKREPACTVNVTAAGQVQVWLTEPLIKDWVVAYRVVFRGRGARRRAHIVELRVTSRTFLADEATDPRAPFSFEAVRRGVTERQFRTALAATVEELTTDPFLRPVADTLGPAPHLQNGVEGRGAGRPGRTRTFYAKFACRLHDIEQDMRREPGASTHAQLVAEYGKPRTTIAKWVRIAREQGFLTPARKGERGGKATAPARALARGDK
jgi:hypothetical protein